MMSVTVRENLIEALEGRTPKTTPYSVYDWNMGAIIPDELTARMQEPVTATPAFFPRGCSMA